MSARLSATALMLSNLVIGLAVLGPAGMLEELAVGFSVTIRDAGFLIAYGAVVLCICSPLVTWLTSTLDRRVLLTGALALVSASLAASAIAPDYGTFLAVRLFMLGVGAIITPLAASTIAMLVTEQERPSRISYVFLGWSLALAAGLPIVTVLTEQLGWRLAYGALALAGTINTVLLAVSLPSGLRGAPLSLQSWGEIARNRQIVLLLLVTTLWTAGLYVILPYLGPLLTRLAGAGVQVVGVFFAIMGVAGLVGNVIATRAVNAIGPFRMSLVAIALMTIGALVWSVGAGALSAMAAGIILIGMGISVLNSMNQARLVAAAPTLASASVALNSSWLYVGQAIGSSLGGELFVRDLLVAMGYGTTAFMLMAMVLLAMTRTRG